MLSLIVIFGMVVLALRFLWDGRIPVSRTHVATGVPVKIFGIVLLISGPVALAIVALLAAAGQQGLISFRTPDDTHGAFWFTLLGLPAAAALIAIFFAKPKDQVPPMSDERG
jgi:hypothetical protein